MEMCHVCKTHNDNCRIRTIVRYKDKIYRYYWCKVCASDFWTSDKIRKIRRHLIRVYNKRNPLKYRARYTLNNAIACGNIIKSSRCAYCESTEKLEAHHDDYSKPLNVVWLCKECHRKIPRAVL